MAITPKNGVKALSKIQLGLQSTYAAVAATTIWRGMGSLKDGREIKHVEEDIGIAQPTTRNYTPKLGAEIALDPIEATFQQAGYLLRSGVSADNQSQDGVGSGWIYPYAFPTTSINSLDLHTVEVGDGEEAEEVEACFVESFKLSGNAQEGIMMEGKLLGRQVSDTAFTPALSVPTLSAGDHIVFGGSNLYIDAVGGTIGSTEILGTLLKFELDVTTGYKMKPTNLAKHYDFVYWDKGSFNAVLKFTFEHDANSEAQKDIYVANTPQLFRLLFTGNALATPAAESNLSFRIDGAGVYTDFENGEIDGNNTKEATIQLGYDMTAALGLSFRIVNELSALP